MLDKDQTKIVNDTAKSIMVIAGPGAGKTRTLIAKTCQKIKDGSSKHSLLLTFTNKAASEMRTRLEQQGIDKSQVDVKTIHSLAYMIVSENTETNDFVKNTFEKGAILTGDED